MKDRKPRKDALQNREAIVQSARILFTEHGVEGVSMREIARHAGVGQGSLYRHFTNKGDLCYTIIADGYKIIDHKISQYLLDHAQDPASERFKTILGFFIDFTESNTTFLLEIQRNMAGVNVPHNAACSHNDNIFQLIKGLVDELQSAGTGEKQDSSFYADIVMISLMPDRYLAMKQERNYSLADIKNNINKIFVEPLISGNKESSIHR